ncbi:hypothetical protein ABZ907_15645 [Nonomuraea wenchangensis]
MEHQLFSLFRASSGGSNLYRGRVPRTSPSPADRALVEHAAAHGVTVSARQLERWRADGLLPRNRVRGLGQGRGSSSIPPEEAWQLVVWLGQHAGPGIRPGDLALQAFGEGLPVPEATVRNPFAAACKLPTAQDSPPGGTAEDVADANAVKCRRKDLLPSRIRSIDSAIATALESAGTSAADVAQAILAPFGRPNPPTQEAWTRRDWVYSATLAAIEGADSVNIAQMGAMARSLAPAGIPAPAAEDLEFRWPGSEQEAEQLLTPDGGLAFLPDGSMTQVLLELAAETPLSDLREAWDIAVHLPVWAVGLCDRVETALITREFTEALTEWVSTMSGPARLRLVAAIDSVGQSPQKTAFDALVLLFERQALQAVLAQIPEAEVDNLTQPWMYPSFMVSFMTEQISTATAAPFRPRD